MRNLKILTILTAFSVSVYFSPKADAQLLNPCCRPVPVCCGPVIVRRPVVRNAMAELRMAMNYHLNYRFYRGVIYSTPEGTHHDKINSPTPAENHSAEKPYHEESAEQGDSVLQPVQPTQPAPEVAPQQPQSAPVQPASDPPANEPEEQPADPPVEDDAFQIEKSTTATIMLTVPKNALVTINGRPTSSTGTIRTFVSHNLEPSTRYRYNVEVRWSNDTSHYKVVEAIELKSGGTIAKSFANPYSPTVVKK